MERNVGRAVPKTEKKLGLEMAVCRQDVRPLFVECQFFIRYFFLKARGRVGTNHYYMVILRMHIT